MAAGVLFSIAGIVREHAILKDDAQLVKDVAGELNYMSRHMPGGALHASGEAGSR